MKILIAIDGSIQSNAALDKVNRLNLSSEDMIKIVTVVDMALPMSLDIYGGMVPDTSELEKIARSNSEKNLYEAKSELTKNIGDLNVNISSDLLFGSADSRIVETAEEWNADLIIVGSHGYSRWERMLLGSVSDSVVHHAHCSVLVVRTKPASE